MITAARLAAALPTIRTSLSKFAKDKDALDELVQNAALKIWANRAKCCYKQSSLILKWMLLVAKRTALRAYRDATSKARSWADLPAQAINYVRRIEELVGAPVALLSTSPERDDTILVHDPFQD